MKENNPGKTGGINEIKMCKLIKEYQNSLIKFPHKNGVGK